VIDVDVAIAVRADLFCTFYGVAKKGEKQTKPFLIDFMSKRYYLLLH